MARLLIGNIKGPQGAQGIQGPQGPVGPTGPQGPMPELSNNALATQAGVAALDAVMGKTLQAQITQQNSNYETLNSSKLDREVFVSVYNYLTTSNIDTIFRGIYWVNGYGRISGDLPFTNCHYMLIATANEMQSSRMQLAISLSDKSIKFRYYAGTPWTAWQ